METCTEREATELKNGSVIRSSGVRFTKVNGRWRSMPYGDLDEPKEYPAQLIWAGREAGHNGSDAE